MHRDRWSGTPQASCGLRDRGGWWARRATAGWASAAEVWRARCASAAAGEFFGLALPVVAMKAEPGEDLTDLGFERVAVARDEFVFELLVTVGDVRVFGALVVEFRHAAGE